MPDATCSIDECDRKVKARGWCNAHYQRWANYGDPEAAGQRAPRGSGAIVDGRKMCASCRATFALDKFVRSSITKDGYSRKCVECEQEHRRAYYAKNAERLKAKQRAYEHNNPEKVKAAKRARYQANRKEILAKQREYYRANSERIKARANAYYYENVERHQENGRKWKEANPEREQLRYTRGNRKRRSHKANNAYVYYSSDQLLARLAYYGNKCYICGGEGTEVDHVKPVSKGGPEMLANLRPICRRDNLWKRAKWPYALIVLRIQEHRVDEVAKPLQAA